MNKVSVIIPTYNCASYIKEALLSVFNQTVLPHEIVIVDDGANDNTEEIVQSFGSHLIRYIKQPNSGVSAARNRGLEHTTGDLIAFLDADDRWLPTMLERQTKTLLSDPDIVLSFTNFVRFDDPPSDNIYPPQFKFYPELESIPTINGYDKSVKIISGDGFCHLVSFCEVPAYTQSIMLRRSLIDDLRFDITLKICEDLEFILRCATRGKVAFNNDILLEVRRHTNNATRDISLISVDKLTSFIKLSNENDFNSFQRASLQKRLIQAYWSSAKALAKKGLVGSSWRHARSALRLGYSPLLKLKNFLGWLFVVLVSIKKNIRNG